MTFEYFLQQVEGLRSNHPDWFGGFRETWPNATNEEIQTAELELRVNFPEEYKKFLLEFGGGEFGFSKIFSVNQGDEENISKINKKYLSDRNFIAFNDDGTGGYYGFAINDAKCSSNVYYYDPDDGDDMKKVFDDFFVSALYVLFNVK